MNDWNAITFVELKQLRGPRRQDTALSRAMPATDLTHSVSAAGRPLLLDRSPRLG
jgi:hypothetical protein